MTCVHYELMTWKKGKLFGTCKWCDQVKDYGFGGHDKPIIIKEGNMEQNEQSEIGQAEAVPYKMSKGEIHRYFEKHKEQILADARTLGQVAARKKWGIKSSTWCYLIKRWVPEHAPYTDPLINKAPGEPYPQLPSTVKNPSLFPKFPEWDNAWSDRVKIAWLECYQALMGVRKEEKNG